MKKIINKNNMFIFIMTFILLFFIHFSLMNKNIVSADILLNNYYYNGYSWEISLGRFGLLIIGIIKSFLNVPVIDLVISYILIGISNVFILKLFKIKVRISQIILVLFMCVSPIISSILLFNYCSIGYLIAFLGSILSLYFYYNSKNKLIKYILPISLIVLSLSMYQAYLSFIISIYVIYNIKLIIENKVKYRDSLKYLLCIILGTIVYYLLMKLSLIVFHIDMSSYSNADKIGISTLLSIPNKIIESYKLFYKFFFTDLIMKNKYMYNNILNVLLILTFIMIIIFNIIKNKTNKPNIIVCSILIILLPVFLNSVIFVINDSKLQLLMSASYLTIPIMIFSLDYKFIKYIVYCIIILLMRNYLVQDQASYLTLENTFNKYDTVISTAINNNINDLDKKFIVVGEIKNNSKISKMNYGFVSDQGLFWDEYNLRKLGFERFCLEYHGLDLEFGSENDYNNEKNSDRNELVYNKDNLIIINLDNYKKKNN